MRRALLMLLLAAGLPACYAPICTLAPVRAYGTTRELADEHIDCYDVEGIYFHARTNAICPPYETVVRIVRAVRRVLNAPDDEFLGGFVLFTNDDLLCGTEGSPTSGCTRGSVSVIRITNVSWQRVLRHELGHQYRYHHGMHDFEHSDEAWWRKVERAR